MKERRLLRALTSLTQFPNSPHYARFSQVLLTDDDQRAIISGQGHLDSPVEQWDVRISATGRVHLLWHNGLDAYTLLSADLFVPTDSFVPLTLIRDKDRWLLTGNTVTVVIDPQGTIEVQVGPAQFFYTHFYRHNQHVRCALKTTLQEHLYALGEKVGRLDKKGRLWTQWTTDAVPHEDHTDPLYQAIPFALLGQAGPQGFRGIFLANSARTYFDATMDEWLWIGADDGPLSLYALPGPHPQDVLRHYTELTGRFPMPPQYALGFQQSRYSYMDEQEVVEIAQTFRKRSLPLDLIYLDIDYMDGYRVFTFNPHTFPDPKNLAQTLAAQGIGLVCIVDPGVKVDANYSVYCQGHTQQYFMEYLNGEEFHSEVWPGVCAFPDFAQSRTRNWWAGLHRPLQEAGIQGIWNDMNEPAWWGLGQAGPASHPDEESGIVHHTDHGQMIPHHLVHNLYALLEAHATYDALSSSSSRPFILSRSGFSGIQRYAAVWTGDNSSQWEHLAMAIPMCLNLGLSGIPLVGADIGGFLDNASPELYARWIQAGSFFPFARAHSAIDTARHEPWSFGEEVLDIARRYLQYRYRLLPYWYSLLYQAHQDGSPMMRPTFWVDAAPPFLTVDDQFLIGNDLLVAPVIEKGANKKSVHIPSGQWYDPWHHQWITGPRHIIVDAPLAVLPVFLRAGAILPLANIVQSTREWPHHSPWPSVIWIVPGHGSLNFYGDDGHSLQYQTGAYFIIQLSVSVQETTLVVHWSRLYGQDALIPDESVLFKIGPLVKTQSLTATGDGTRISGADNAHYIYVMASLRKKGSGTITIKQDA
ncbi:MAG: alpha-glucosidase [Sulfobacillus thermosulfidooxidans]|nr:MAG: alpha-glucosidase [Sulfobacillus thermosulfidooxidans]